MASAAKAGSRHCLASIASARPRLALTSTAFGSSDRITHAVACASVRPNSTCRAISRARRSSSSISMNHTASSCSLHPGPMPLVQQQIISLRDDQFDLRRHRDRASYCLLNLRAGMRVHTPLPLLRAIAAAPARRRSRRHRTCAVRLCGRRNPGVPARHWKGGSRPSVPRPRGPAARPAACEATVDLPAPGAPARPSMKRLPGIRLAESSASACSTSRERMEPPGQRNIKLW